MTTDYQDDDLVRCGACGQVIELFGWYCDRSLDSETYCDACFNAASGDCRHKHPEDCATQVWF